MINNFIIRQLFNLVLDNIMDNQNVPNSKKASIDQNDIIKNGFNLMKKQNRKYMKVSLQTKQQLHLMVYQQGKKIKEAAKILGIKYATAKTIVFHKRQKRKARGKCGIKMCGYTKKMGNRVSYFQIISITGIVTKYSMEYMM
ncbi:unnamed protein product [Paramecium pentaurelia]|uniref:Uncharacterized protein n=1 Tax=Paramecium pentaurelia TaxID=43138 RepID=A0A8S1Y224_9CILI|nr:unnamed protein product [Paramecium pentaurelia]